MAEASVRYRGKKKDLNIAKDGNHDDKKADEHDLELRTSSGDLSELKNSFYLTRVVFLRCLAFIYFIAFLVSFHQNKELIGKPDKPK